MPTHEKYPFYYTGTLLNPRVYGKVLPGLFPPEGISFSSYRRELFKNFLRAHVQRFEHLTFENFHMPLWNVHIQIITYIQLPSDGHTFN